FLDGDDLLLLARSALALVLLVQELAIILNAADRRHCIRRNLNQIQRPLAGHLQGIERRHDAELLAILVNDADLAGANSFVSADKTFCGAFIDRGNKLPPRRASQAAMPMLDWIAFLNSRLRIPRSIAFCAGCPM